MIGGNTKANIQVKSKSNKNAIGESVISWKTVHSINGWLDYQSGDSGRSAYGAKVQDSTHVFVTDYFDYRHFYLSDEHGALQDLAGNYILDTEGNKIGVAEVGMRPENTRLVIDGALYEIKLIDDPMELHQQIEIYLRFVGGTNG